MSDEPQVPPKKRPSGCLLTVIVIAVILAVVMGIENSKSPCQKYDEAKKNAQETTGDLNAHYVTQMMDSGCR